MGAATSWPGFRRPAMEKNRTQSDRKRLEARTIVAHREYLEAFAAWEAAASRCERGECSLSAEERARFERASEVAKALTEQARIAFRDLLDELGYIPEWEKGVLALNSIEHGQRCIH
jgi:hypothetical protein